MIDALHGALTDSQAARVAALFADEFFGSDPAAFIYEIDERGEIIGRRPISAGPRSARRNNVTRSRIAAFVDADPSEDQIRRVSWLFDYFADQIIAITNEHAAQVDSMLEVQS